VKVKWLGLLSGGWMVWSLIAGGTGTRGAIAVALGTFALFCGSTLSARVRGRVRAARPTAASRYVPEPRKARVCARCGKSDADDKTLEFRVCDCAERCHGKLTEYCLEHAKAH
jgi:hypothetical protein